MKTVDDLNFGRGHPDATGERDADAEGYPAGRERWLNTARDRRLNRQRRCRRRRRRRRRHHRMDG